MKVIDREGKKYVVLEGSCFNQYIDGYDLAVVEVTHETIAAWERRFDAVDALIAADRDICYVGYRDYYADWYPRDCDAEDADNTPLWSAPDRTEIDRMKVHSEYIEFVAVTKYSSDHVEATI